MKKTTLLSFGTAVVSAAIISFVAYGCGDDDVAATPRPDSGASSSSGGSRRRCSKLREPHRRTLRAGRTQSRDGRG